MEQKLSPEFWDTFGRRHWERDAFAGMSSLLTRPTSPEELFGVVKTVCSDRQFSRDVPIIVYRNGTEQHGADAERLFPLSSDGSFTAHIERLKESAGDAEYCFLVTHPERLHEPLWRWSRDFLKGLFRSVGMNSLGVFYALFYGNYKRTPFGVHRDPESVFHFPIQGRKAIRVWPSDAFDLSDPVLQSTSYERSLGQSVLLEAEPGGLLYWPSNFWHIGEGNGELSVSLALSMFCFDQLDAAVATHLLRSIVEEQGDLRQSARGNRQLKFDPDNLALSSGQVPPEIREAAGRLQARLSDEALAVTWLKICSAYGFLTPPDLLPYGDMHLDSKVSLRTGDSILYKELSERRTAVVANGHAVFTGCLGVRTAIQLLESEDRIPVRSLIKALILSEDVSDSNCTPDALNVLQHLVRSRAVSLES